MPYLTLLARNPFAFYVHLERDGCCWWRVIVFREWTREDSRGLLDFGFGGGGVDGAEEREIINELNLAAEVSPSYLLLLKED